MTPRILLLLRGVKGAGRWVAVYDAAFSPASGLLGCVVVGGETTTGDVRRHFHASDHTMSTSIEVTQACSLWQGECSEVDHSYHVGPRYQTMKEAQEVLKDES